MVGHGGEVCEIEERTLSCYRCVKLLAFGKIRTSMEDGAIQCSRVQSRTTRDMVRMARAQKSRYKRRVGGRDLYSKERVRLRRDGGGVEDGACCRVERKKLGLTAEVPACGREVRRVE